MKYAVQTQNLTKEYNKTLCVDHIDLRIPEGSIYGFLGPNGAGKSTTMKMLLGLVKPTEGKAQILGQTLNDKNRLEILKETGSLIESPSYYAHLTGRENLQIVCLLKQVPEKRIDEVLHIVRMEKQQNKKAGHYSLGMKQRLGLAAALLGNPKLTHTGIIDRGCLIWQDTLAHLHEHSRKQIRLRVMNSRAAFGYLTSRKVACKMDGDSILFRDMPDEELAALMRGLTESGVGLLRIEELQQNLEDIFLDLTGRKVSL